MNEILKSCLKMVSPCLKAVVNHCEIKEMVVATSSPFMI